MHFNVLIFGMLMALVVLCSILQVLVYRPWQSSGIGNNPQFLKFQRGYFAVYMLAIFADWLQGPYLYKLYSYYGFQEDQIAVLYVVGFASTVLLGTWAPIAADRFGRKKLCVAFSIVYSVSCFLKLSSNFLILLLGRLLGGIATSVLFSAFEAWYVHEHMETNDFPKEWIAVTFSKASMWNGILAAAAGIVANSFTAVGFSPVAPYMFAVPFLIVAGALVWTHWSENYSGHKTSFRTSCTDGLRSIFSSEKIFFLGLIEALYESVIYIIIFLWTPILDAERPPLGVIFSCFMTAILIGSAVFHLLSRNLFQRASRLLVASSAIACLATLVCVYSTHPSHRNVEISFVALLVFQFSVGIYFPTMGFLRGRVLPDVHRLAIMNWFRVPINLIACVVLMLLHEDVFQHGNRWIFAICSALLFLASFCGARFVTLSKNEEETNERPFMETEHYHNIF